MELIPILIVIKDKQLNKEKQIGIKYNKGKFFLIGNKKDIDEGVEHFFKSLITHFEDLMRLKEQTEYYNKYIKPMACKGKSKGGKKGKKK